LGSLRRQGERELESKASGLRTEGMEILFEGLEWLGEARGVVFGAGRVALSGWKGI
jgi:hypothetical protein